ncbi:methyltransferase [Desulfonatronum sp. SC1]|uniref:class I SAM-dependent methyltransferase n=1 Tax=Desulfonatronum sp. SC1 TaxID=2109626 RepID=UPI000D31F5A9|nr:methyltransferase domain-containing protein [Desulfonatronum sp. SC1]PTN38765.1 methyltransferase [Desulfonatronum sp. SC1]
MAKPNTGKAGAPTDNSRLQLLSWSVSGSELSRLLEQASLDQLLELVSARHAVHFETVRIGENVLECLQLTDMEAYIEQRLNLPSSEVASGTGPGYGIDALPLWAKIWPASLPLAMYMRGVAPGPGERVLEIGAGLGLAGLFAAKRGFSVVLSDIVPEALLFARINALRNGLGDTVVVQAVNFMKENHSERYHRIIASEVLYREHFFAPLLSFLRTHLEPVATAEILLSASAGRRSIKFFAAAKDFFQISRSLVSSPVSSTDSSELPGTEAQQDTYLYRLRPR